MSTIKKFIYDVIQDDNVQDQNVFLKLYPVFNLRHSIIKYWIGTFKQTINKNKDDLTDDDMRREQNTLRFLKNGLQMGYLKINIKYLKKILVSFPNKKTQVDIARIIFNPHQISKTNIIDLQYDKVHYSMEDSSENIDVDVKSHFNTFSFDDITPDDFVEAVNNYYLKIYNKINSHEIIYKITRNSNKKIPNLNILFDFFKKISIMVPTEILVKTNEKKKRIQIIEKFISIGNKFLKTNNFEALFAVISGLNSRTIQRIKLLWKPNKEHTKRFNRLADIISHVNNYANYRNLIKDKTNYIPYLGLLFSDIEHCLQIDIVNDCSTINLNTYWMLAQIIDSYEIVIPPIEKYLLKKNIVSVIKYISDYFIVDEECLYAISNEIQKPISMHKIFQPRVINLSTPVICQSQDNNKSNIRMNHSQDLSFNDINSNLKINKCHDLSQHAIKRSKTISTTDDSSNLFISFNPQRLSITEQTNQNRTQIKDKIDSEFKNISLKLSGRINSFRKKPSNVNLNEIQLSDNSKQ